MMKSKLLSLLSILTLHCMGQSISIGYMHGGVNLASINYYQKVNKVISLSSGIGTQLNDSVTIKYDINGLPTNKTQVIIIPTLLIGVSAKTITKPIYGTIRITGMFNKNAITQFLTLGIGYEMNNMTFELTNNFTLQSYSYGCQVGFNF